MWPMTNLLLNGYGNIGFYRLVAVKLKWIDT